MNSPRLKSIVKLFESCRYTHDLYTVFGDWCEISAIALSNAVDLGPAEKREARFQEIARKYGPETMGTLSKIMGNSSWRWTTVPTTFSVRPSMRWNCTTKRAVSSSRPVCKLMARIVAGSAGDIQKMIAERGFMLAQEPAAGSGAMIIALAEAILEAGINYQQCLHVTAVDIDPRGVHMAYIQLSLLHILATVIVGDTPAMRFIVQWHTLARVMGGWPSKAREGRGGREAYRPLLIPAMVLAAEKVVVASSPVELGSAAPDTETNAPNPGPLEGIDLSFGHSK